jgi:hypothetical protein
MIYKPLAILAAFNVVFAQEPIMTTPNNGERLTTDYQIMIKTGTQFGAGVNGKVFIQIGDDHNQKVNSFLPNHLFNLGRNSRSTFTVQSRYHFDNVCSLVLGHSDKWYGDSWFVEYVQVTDGVQHWTFPINQWIDNKNPGGRPIINVNKCGGSTPSFNSITPPGAPPGLMGDPDALFDTMGPIPPPPGVGPGAPPGVGPGAPPGVGPVAPPGVGPVAIPPPPPCPDFIPPPSCKYIYPNF